MTDTDPDEAVEAAREQVIEGMARSAEIYGLNRSYGRLYGVLYFADEPLSLDELVERSGYAKSTISNAMGTMEHLHMVYRRTVPGTGKRAYFEAETDFWYMLQQLMQQEVKREIQTMTRSLDEAEETLDEAPESADVAADLERIRDLRRMARQGNRLLDLLSRLPIDRLLAFASRFRDEE